MEQGNEGDEIILLAFRQIECAIDENVRAVSQLGAEAIVEIVARSLWLISNGDIKFPVALPQNIASKHRICTNMAAKVKEMGFTGDMGYNQLLYPVESQTRTLLNWLVQKLPRTDDGSAEDVLAGNALLNKRMMDSVAAWKAVPWRLPFCMKGGRNLYYSRPASTHQTSMKKGILPVYHTVTETFGSVSTSVFELHARALNADSDYAQQLENEYHEGSNSARQTTGSRLVTAAFASVKQSKASAAMAGTGGVAATAVSGRAGSSVSDLKEAEQMTKSLAEIIGALSTDATAEGESAQKARGTRFTHSTEFSHESNVSLLVSTANVSTQGASSGVTDGEAAESGESESTSPVIGVDREAVLKQAAVSRAAQRKAQLEADERKRQQEVDDIREQMLAAEATVEDMERQQSNTSAKTRALENEVLSLQQEGEKLETEILLKRKTLEMLPSAADNIGKLQAICANSAKRLLQLAQEWENHRRPLVGRLRDLKSSKTRRRAQCKKMVEDMKRCRGEMEAMVQDLKEKQEKSQLLTEEVSKLPRNINRTLYTYRIMDIIASIGKQNKEIAKITSDIRDIQKTINTSTNIMTRADAVAEDRIYSAANGPNRSSGMVESYRNLTNLRAYFEELIATVSKIGQLDKQARDLETKVDQEVARVSANNFDRIKADLDEVQKENQKMISQIKAQRVKGR